MINRIRATMAATPTTIHTSIHGHIIAIPAYPYPIIPVSFH
jgi:hypothetical protein